MLLATYLFLMIYAPKIRIWGEMISLVSILLVLRAFFVGAIEPFAVRRLRIHIMALFAGLFFYSLLVIAMNPGFQRYYLLRFGRIGVQFLGGYALLRLYYRKYYDRMGDKILAHLYWVIAAHATIMVLMYFVPQVRSFMLSAIRVTTGTRSGPIFLAGRRVGGLTVALDTLSAVQSFGVLLFPLVIGQLRGYKAVLGSAALVVIGFSVFISGRTGVVIVIVLLPVVLFYARRRAFMLFLKLALAVLVLVAAVAVITPGAEVQKQFESEKTRLIHLLTPSERGGAGFQEGATAKLINDYLYDWPKDPRVFMFGNSTSSRGLGSPHFVSADPGYILDVYGIGIIGLSLILFFYVICLWHARKCFSYHKLLGAVAFTYVLLALVVNGKVLFALAREGFTISVVLLVACVYLRSIEVEDYDENQACQLDGLDEYDQYGDSLPQYVCE